ncbi:hypothetical protein RRG08_063993 [Elysia crispata]|uniref:Uncharacterized protein n=1 Tax=Elysia crispata TaxID=231223 RepID=A0AAE0YF53_9GAST|nr:hypothetical protein RRG08_063993 [Elysia crispata]
MSSRGNRARRKSIEQFIDRCSLAEVTKERSPTREKLGERVIRSTNKWVWRQQDKVSNLNINPIRSPVDSLVWSPQTKPTHSLLSPSASNLLHILSENELIPKENHKQMGFFLQTPKTGAHVPACSLTALRTPQFVFLQTEERVVTVSRALSGDELPISFELLCRTPPGFFYPLHVTERSLRQA